MRLRHAVESDADQLESFDLGDLSSPWITEVAEILAGLLAWQADPHARDEDRQVIVAVEADAVLAVVAHVRLVGDNGTVWADHRYLMVTAVRIDHRRTGLAQTLVESTIADLRAEGCESVEWLVHPRNRPSIEFSRSLFPAADETQPPEDHPYVSFALGL